MNIIKLKNKKKAVKFELNGKWFKGLVVGTFIGLSGKTTYQVDTKEGVLNVEADATVEIPMVSVFYEKGYRWSVDVSGEGESRATGLNKTEAMKLAKAIVNKEFNGEAVINEQKLTKEQKAENISYLHQTTETYHDAWRYY